MTQYLPPNLLALFAPRDPVPYLAPLDKLPHEKKNTGYTPVGSFLRFFEDPKDTPPPTRVETREERLERKRREKQEQAAYKLEQDIALWEPMANPNCTSDPYKTLFIARINYDTSESKLRREFEVYGPVKKIHLVHDTKSGKPRGYAFIEYEHERDMHSAYKHADGKKIDGRRVLVDVERARTVKGWLPRRLGGGLGGTRRGGPDVNIKHSGREEMRGDDRIDRGAGNDTGVTRDRERDRERRRSHSRSRDSRRRNKSRSRSREPRRRDRRNKRSSRDRDKDRRGGDRDGLEEKLDGDMNDGLDENSSSKRDRKRSRSRDRDRKRRRSRSRSHDRERKKRDRGRRDRDHEERPAKQSQLESSKRNDEEDNYSNGPQNEDEGGEEYNENSADYGSYHGNQYSEYGGENDENSSSQYYDRYNSGSYEEPQSYDMKEED